MCMVIGNDLPNKRRTGGGSFARKIPRSRVSPLASAVQILLLAFPGPFNGVWLGLCWQFCGTDSDIVSLTDLVSEALSGVQVQSGLTRRPQIGRASCRERV